MFPSLFTLPRIRDSSTDYRAPCCGSRSTLRFHVRHEGCHMEPVTTLGFGAITAYLAKDGIAKLLGPTAAYLGEGLRDLTHRRGREHRKDLFKRLGEARRSTRRARPSASKSPQDGHERGFVLRGIPWRWSISVACWLPRGQSTVEMTEVCGWPDSSTTFRLIRSELTTSSIRP